MLNLERHTEIDLENLTNEQSERAPPHGMSEHLIFPEAYLSTQGQMTLL